MKKVQIYQYITQLNSDFSDFLTSYARVKQNQKKNPKKTLLKALLTRVCDKRVKK